MMIWFAWVGGPCPWKAWKDSALKSKIASVWLESLNENTCVYYQTHELPYVKCVQQPLQKMAIYHALALLYLPATLTLSFFKLLFCGSIWQLLYLYTFLNFNFYFFWQLLYLFISFFNLLLYSSISHLLYLYIFLNFCFIAGLYLTISLSWSYFNFCFIAGGSIWLLYPALPAVMTAWGRSNGASQ